MHENTNGFIRRLFPQGRDWSHVTEAEYKKSATGSIIDRERPLGHLTPHEVFIETTTSHYLLRLRLESKR